MLKNLWTKIRYRLANLLHPPKNLNGLEMLIVLIATVEKDDLEALYWAAAKRLVDQYPSTKITEVVYQVTHWDPNTHPAVIVTAARMAIYYEMRERLEKMGVQL